ncbi:MAG: excinuclease ABC subunit UvrB, partial [Caulobacter sp.]|nr:excinuclease ABC subunit UvrB [Caulobacter sp.]
MARSPERPAGVEDVSAAYIHDLANAHTPPMWAPHRPARPAKSQGGIPLRLVSDYEPAGDQPTAIRDLVAGIAEREHDQVLLGVTGSGKT